MIEQIKNCFPQVELTNCLWTSDKVKIFIYDQKEDKVIEVNADEPFHFQIQNPTQKEIAILAIDKCVFDDDSGHKKCDFAALDDEVFIFVEIKDTYKRSGSKKKKAKDQL